MPPQISDDESSDGPEEIPARQLPAKAEALKDEDKSEDGEDEDEEEEEYKVEKILHHGFTDDGTAIYLIKWDGYEDKSDQTWEPIANLENAPEVLEAYHKKIGGPPQMKSASKKRGRKSAAESELESEPKKRPRKSETNGTSVNKALPEGSWENLITRISSILEDPPEPGKGGKSDGQSNLVALAEWNDGKKTQHTMALMRRKAPQKLLDYYEQHLVFKKDGPDGI